MLSRFLAHGYRNVDAEVELGRVNVLVGPNNSGKSNFLRALRFLADLMTTPSTGRAFDDVVKAHGGPRLGSGPVTLDWVWGDRSYGCSFHPPLGSDAATTAITEGVSDRTDRISRGVNGVVYFGRDTAQFELADYFGGPLDTLLNAGPPVSSMPVAIAKDVEQWWATEYQKAIREFGLGFAYFRCSGLRPSEIAEARKAEDGRVRLDEYAVQLVNALKNLERSSPTLYRAFEDRLRDVMPDLEGVAVRDGGGSRWIELSTRGRGPSELREWSDGTVQAVLLAYLTAPDLVSHATRFSVLCLDEPELNLHPAWLKHVGDWILRSDEQIFLSTHSPDLLDRLTEGFRRGDVHVFVFEPGGVRRVEDAELATLLDQGWELGDLYRVGEPLLGGWPV